jgi:transcriptional regulator with XRE-family HTH domain
MEKQIVLRQLKNKKIGALLMDARMASSRNIDECANILSLSREEYLSFEKGHIAPSVPQLEALSIYLDISLDHFKGKSSKYEAQQTGYRKNLEKIILVRDRIIGATIRKSRTEQELSLEQLGEKTGIPAGLLENYEFGKVPVPVTELELIAEILNQDINSYYEKIDEQISEKNQQIRLNQFLELSDRLQEFVTKPINRPFLELANKLADLPVDRLRNVAEGLLEITY